MNKFFGLIVLFIALLGHAFGSEISHSNHSSLSFTEAENMPGWICKGTVPKEVNLKELTVIPVDLENGINCVVGDFDGNGYTDFLLFGKYIERGRSILSSPDNYLAVFFKKKKLHHQVIISHPNLSHPFLYSPRKTKGEFGEPTSKTDGFYEPGEGGTTVVFIYNRKNGTFDVSEHASEYH
jgi:hypothetical protein